VHDFSQPEVESRGTDFVRQITSDGRGKESPQGKQLGKKQRDFQNRENKQAGNNREENQREYNQTMRHITYD
jgi:hypothetical protein